MDPWQDASIQLDELQREYFQALEIEDEEKRRDTLLRIQRDVEEINGWLRTLSVSL